MDEYFYEDYIPSYYEKRKYDVKCALAYSCMGFVDNDYSVLLIDKWADTNRTRIPNELFVHYCFAHDVVPFEKDMERSNNIISEYSQLYLFDMMSEKHIENVVSHNQETTEIFNKEKMHLSGHHYNCQCSRNLLYTTQGKMDLKKAEQKILEFNANTQISVDFPDQVLYGQSCCAYTGIEYFIRIEFY